jgi:hypothetical protein
MSDAMSEGFTQAGVNLFRLVFSLMFPIVLVTTCVVAGILAYGFGIPQFALLWVLAGGVIGYAATNLWAGVALAVFVLASVPLAWVAFRELALRISSVLGAWVTAIIFCGFSLWLSTSWAYDSSGWQQLCFAFLLFMGWSAVCEALVGTLKLVFHIRPKPGREIVEKQKAHGHAQLAGEAEAVSLLKKKR